MRRFYWFILLAVWGVIFTGHSHAQQVNIRVLDASNNQACPFATIVSYSLMNGAQLSGTVTAEDGTGILNLNSRSRIVITSIGYLPVSDTISPGESKTYFLEPQSFNVKEVVVTGQYKPVPVDKSIYKVSVIGSRTIEDKASNNLAELLSGEPNIKVSQDGVLGSSLSMQGMTGENVKILVDGIPVIGRMNGNIDLAQIDLSNIGHVEIIEGPMSVVYGTNALAGTINLITKKNNSNRLTTQLNGYYESVGIYNVDAALSVQKSKHTFSVNGARKFFDGYSNNDSLRTPMYKPKLQYNLGLGYQYSRNNTTLRYKGELFHEELRQPGEIKETPSFVIARDQYFYTIRTTNSLSFNHQFNNNSLVDVLAAFSTYSREKRTLVKDFTTLDQEISPNPTDHDTTYFSSVLFRGFYSQELKKFNYQAGLDINLDYGEGKRIADTSDTMIGDYAVFLSGQYQFSEYNTIQPGLRFIYNTKYKAPLIPSLNLKWRMFGALNFRASYAKGFRAPSLKELYLDFVDANHNIHGNDSLEAETSDSYNFSLGYDYEKPSFFMGLEASFFYNHGRDVIALVNIAGEDLYYKNVNLDTRKTYGTRLNINMNPLAQLNIQAGVAFTGVAETVYLTVSDSTLDQGIWVPTSRDTSFLSDYVNTADLTFNLSYRLLKYDLVISSYYKYNGQASSLFTTQDEYGEDILERRILEPYHTLDVTITKHLFNKRLSLAVGGKNLFDNTTIMASNRGGGTGHSSGGLYNPVGWGRTWFFKISYRFNR